MSAANRRLRWLHSAHTGAAWWLKAQRFNGPCPIHRAPGSPPASPDVIKKRIKKDPVALREESALPARGQEVRGGRAHWPKDNRFSSTANRDRGDVSPRRARPTYLLIVYRWAFLFRGHRSVHWDWTRGDFTCFRASCASNEAVNWAVGL